MLRQREGLTFFCLLRAVLCLQLLLAIGLAQAQGNTITVGGASLNLDTLQQALRENLKDQISSALKDGRDKIEGELAEIGNNAERKLHEEALRWVRVEVYKEHLPDKERREMKKEQPPIKPNDDPRFDAYMKRWAQTAAPGEVDLVTRAYLQTGAAQALMKDLTEGASKEIGDGLNGLLDDASKKFKRFTEAVEEAEKVDTPSTKLLEKHGFSGKWVDTFKQRETQFRRLQAANDRYRVVDSLRLVADAFQADLPRQKIGLLFGLMEKLGSTASDSRIPIVSFFGDVVHNYAQVATQMLAAVNRLETMIRKREGYCLGPGVHAMEDARQKAFQQQFGYAILVCPTDVLPEIYVKTEPSDNSKLYFFIDDHFVPGNADAGGLDGLYQARQLIIDAAANGYARYAGKEKDVRMLAGVFNLRYVAPSPEKRTQYGGGLPGLVHDADDAIDGISTRLDSMEKLVPSSGAQCSTDKLHAFLYSRTGLSAKDFHEAEARLDELKFRYVMNYVDTHLVLEAASAASSNPLSELGSKLKSLFASAPPAQPAPASDAGGGGGGAYGTYSRIWQKMEQLSLLRVDGEVRGKSSSVRCTACAGAKLSLLLTVARELPGCELHAADPRGAFAAYLVVNAPPWALDLRTDAGGQGGASEKLTPTSSRISTFPFIASASLNLLIAVSPSDAAANSAGAPPATEPPPPDTADPNAGDKTVQSAIEQCDFALAAAQLPLVRNARQRGALEQALALRRQQHAEFVATLRQAESDARDEEPYRALDTLRGLDSSAACPRDRDLAAQAVARVQAAITEADDRRLSARAESSIAECRYTEALQLIANISAGRRGDLEQRANTAQVSYEQARKLRETGRQAMAQGRREEGLALLRQARNASTCSKWVAALDAEIGQPDKPGSAVGATTTAPITAPTDRAALLAGADCSAYPHTKASWDEKLGRLQCACVSGFRWDGKVCVVDKAALLAATHCSQWPHTEARWSDATQAPQCQCVAGYQWNTSSGSCVGQTREQQVAAFDCSHVPNTVARWNGDAPGCFCKDDYRLTADKKACQPMTRAEMVANANCENNSRAYWDKDKNRVRCLFCQPGHHWRGSDLECDPDDTEQAQSPPQNQPANENAPNLGAALGNLLSRINEANQTHANQMSEIERNYQRDKLANKPPASVPPTSGNSALKQCVQCVNALIGGACYARVPSLAGWGLCISCTPDGGVEPGNRFIDRDKCPVCKNAGWKLEDFKAYKHN